MPVKQEPSIPECRVKSIPLEKRLFESSSVFEVPNPTDDIICLDDSQPLLLMASDEGFAAQMQAKPTEFKLSPEQTVRTEYRQQIQTRTKRDKAAQPGHMCPDCAKVSVFFKYLNCRNMVIEMIFFVSLNVVV